MNPQNDPTINGIALVTGASHGIGRGATATDFSGGLLRDNEQVQATVSSLTALRRYGLAADISGAIAALLEDRNHWVNGQRIEVSGGVHLLGEECTPHSEMGPPA